MMQLPRASVRLALAIVLLGVLAAPGALCQTYTLANFTLPHNGTGNGTSNSTGNPLDSILAPLLQPKLLPIRALTTTDISEALAPPSTGRFRSVLRMFLLMAVGQAIYVDDPVVVAPSAQPFVLTTNPNYSQAVPQLGLLQPTQRAPLVKIDCGGRPHAFIIRRASIQLDGLHIFNCTSSAILVDVTTKMSAGNFNSLEAFQAVAVQVTSTWFSGNTAARGGGLAVVHGWARVADCDFVGNTAADGSAIFVGANSVLTEVVRSNFTSNRALMEPGMALPGSAIAITPGGCVVQIDSCRFIGNVGQQAGAISLQASACSLGGTVLFEDATVRKVPFRIYNITIANSTFVGNEAAAGHGAALNFDKPKHGIYFVRNVLLNNKASGCGGALAGMLPQGPLLIYSSHFEGNVAQGSGGAVCLYYPPINNFFIAARVDVINSSFVANAANSRSTVKVARQCRGVCPSSTATLEARQQLSSLQSGLGGAIFADSVALSMAQCDLIRNAAPIEGGGMYLSRLVMLNATRLTVRGNAAATGGGASLLGILFASSIAQSVFSGNRASGDEKTPGVSGSSCLPGGGGALCLSGAQGSLIALNTSLFENNRARFGGALYVRQDMCQEQAAPCWLNIPLSNSFLNNSADGGAGGAVFFTGDDGIELGRGWQQPASDAPLTPSQAIALVPYSASNTVQNGYGPGIASRPTKMVLRNFSAMGQPVARDSGLSFEVEVMDYFGQPVLHASPLPFALQVDSLTTPVTAPGRIYIQNGRGTVDGLKLYGPTATHVVTVSLLFQGKVSASVPLKIQIRDCVVGEVLDGSGCRLCTNNQYTFSPLNRSCDTCPEFSHCYGSALVPNAGFWHSHPRSPQVHRCPLKYACSYAGRNKQLELWHNISTGTAVIPPAAVDIYKTSLCAQGYSGNVCGVCSTGFGRMQQRCLKCPSAFMNRLAFLGAKLVEIGIIAALVYLRLRRQENFQTSPSTRTTTAGAPTMSNPDSGSRSAPRTPEQAQEADVAAELMEAGGGGGDPAEIFKSQESLDFKILRPPSPPTPCSSRIGLASTQADNSPTHSVGPFSVSQSELSSERGDTTYARRASSAGARSARPSTETSTAGLSTSFEAPLPPPMQQEPELPSRGQSPATPTSLDVALSSSSNSKSSQGPPGPQVLATQQGAPASMILEVLVAYMQMLGVLRKLDVHMPVAAAGSTLSMLDLTQIARNLMALDCLLPSSPFGHSLRRTLLNVFLPGGVILLSMAFWSLRWLWNHHRHGRSTPFASYFRERTIITAIQVVYFYYSSITADLLTIFTCKTLDTSGASTAYAANLRAVGQFWSEDLDRRCWKGAHMKLALGLGVPGLLLYSICIPLLILGFMWWHRRELYSNLHFLSRYGHLYEDYKPKYYYWQTITRLRLLLINLVVSFLTSYGAGLQLFGYLGILLAFVGLTIVAHPYADRTVNTLDRAALFMTAATAHMYFALVISRSHVFIYTAVVIAMVGNLLLVAVFLWLLVLRIREMNLASKMRRAQQEVARRVVSLHRTTSRAIARSVSNTASALSRSGSLLRSGTILRSGSMKRSHSWNDDTAPDASACAGDVHDHDQEAASGAGAAEGLLPLAVDQPAADAAVAGVALPAPADFGTAGPSTSRAQLDEPASGLDGNVQPSDSGAGPRRRARGMQRGSIAMGKLKQGGHTLEVMPGGMGRAAFEGDREVAAQLPGSSRPSTGSSEGSSSFEARRKGGRLGLWLHQSGGSLRSSMSLTPTEEGNEEGLEH